MENLSWPYAHHSYGFVTEIIVSESVGQMAIKSAFGNVFGQKS